MSAGAQPEGDVLTDEPTNGDKFCLRRNSHTDEKIGYMNRLLFCVPVVCPQHARIVEDWAGLRPVRSAVRVERETIKAGSATVEVNT